MSIAHRTVKPSLLAHVHPFFYLLLSSSPPSIHAKRSLVPFYGGQGTPFFRYPLFKRLFYFLGPIFVLDPPFIYLFFISFLSFLKASFLFAIFIFFQPTGLGVRVIKGDGHGSKGDRRQFFGDEDETVMSQTCLLFFLMIFFFSFFARSTEQSSQFYSFFYNFGLFVLDCDTLLNL